MIPARQDNWSLTLWFALSRSRRDSWHALIHILYGRVTAEGIKYLRESPITKNIDIGSGVNQKVIVPLAVVSVAFWVIWSDAIVSKREITKCHALPLLPQIMSQYSLQPVCELQTKFFVCVHTPNQLEPNQFLVCCIISHKYKCRNAYCNTHMSHTDDSQCHCASMRLHRSLYEAGNG